MYLIAIDDLVLADLSIEAEFDTLLTDESEHREWSTRTREGIAGSVFFGNVAEPAIWSWILVCPDVTTLDTVLSVLTGDATQERRLLAQRLDVADTRVVARAAPYAIRQIGELTLVVEFEGRNSIWTSESPTETTKTISSDLDQAIPIVVPGNTSNAPRLIIIPTVQRATQTAAVGYRYRRRFTIVNNSDEPWYRLPVRVDLGSTTAHVTAGRAQADGDDVRLVLDGIEQQRSLASWNTGASFLWCLVPNLQPGDSLTYDILSGNPSAVSPPEFAHPNAPAFTMASSSNALWVYPMATSGAGAWGLLRANAPSGIDFTIPGAWRRLLTLDNPDNPDWTYSAPFFPPDAAVGAAVNAKYWGERHPAKMAAVARANSFDGVSIQHPLGMTSITANFQWHNPNGLGALVILGRESAAEPWTTKYRTIVTTATATPHAPGAQAFSPAVQHIACAIHPENGWEMPPESVLYGAVAWWDTTLQVAIDTTDLGITVESAWTEVYELAGTYRIMGGGNAVAPYHELLVGNADGDDGAGAPRATVTMAQGLVIDCEDYTHEVWSQTGGDLVAYVEQMSAHTVIAVEGWWET